MPRYDLTAGERLIVRRLRRSPYQTIDQIKKATGQHREGVARHLTCLKSLSLVEATTGPKGEARYSLSASA